MDSSWLPTSCSSLTADKTICGSGRRDELLLRNFLDTNGARRLIRPLLHSLIGLFSARSLIPDAGWRLDDDAIGLRPATRRTSQPDSARPVSRRNRLWAVMDGRSGRPRSAAADARVAPRRSVWRARRISRLVLAAYECWVPTAPRTSLATSRSVYGTLNAGDSSALAITSESSRCITLALARRS